MKHLNILSTLFLVLTLFFGCTDLKDDVQSSAPNFSLHKDGIANPSSPNFHGKLVSGSKWDMKQCQQCHGSNYNGGTADASCYDCHTSPGGPQACNTCHGVFADPLKIAPPRGLNGSIETTYSGVGAHNKHLYQNELGSDIRCSSCHIYPQSYEAESHIDDDGKAELNFGQLSVNGGANPTYNFADSKCSNTYCHGNFIFRKSKSNYQFVYTDTVMVGKKFAPVWNKLDGTQGECGSCHGLPPTGHIPAALNTCVNCHQGVVDAQGNIVDKTKHINGVANAFGN